MVSWEEKNCKAERPCVPLGIQAGSGWIFCSDNAARRLWTAW